MNPAVMLFDEVTAALDHIYFTDHGVIVEHGPPGQLFGSPRDPRTQEFPSQIL
jgi:polar amino acid transport system ATP-binding protein